MIYTVYKIINTLNNRYYIGVHKTTNPNDSYYGSGLVIKEAIKKHGKENFIKEILFTFENKEDAYNKEKELVNSETLKDPLIYNVQVGGVPTIDWTKDRKEIFSKNMSGKNHPLFGKHHTEDTKKKISESGKGRKHSKETLDKIVATRLQNKKPNPKKGKPLTEEDKLKKSIAAKNRIKIECPHCHKSTDPGNAKQHHFDNCKLKPSTCLEQFVDDSNADCL